MTSLTLGERIGQARREKGVRERRDITQRELAKAVGVTPTSISEWESDKVSPREDALTKLAKYLGVTPAYLRYGVTETDDNYGLQRDKGKSVAETLAELEKPAAKKAGRRA